MEFSTATAAETAKTSVWWDVETMPVPKEVDPHMIAQNIRRALANNGYIGDVTINAYGDTMKIPKSVRMALSITGINLYHAPNAGKRGAKRRTLMMIGMMWGWANNRKEENVNCPTGNYLLISGDPDFLVSNLHSLWRVGYNIVLEHPPSGPLAEREGLLRGILGGWLPPGSISVSSGNQKMQNIVDESSNLALDPTVGLIKRKHVPLVQDPTMYKGPPPRLVRHPYANRGGPLHPREQLPREMMRPVEYCDPYAAP